MSCRLASGVRVPSLAGVAFVLAATLGCTNTERRFGIATPSPDAATGATGDAGGDSETSDAGGTGVTDESAQADAGDEATNTTPVDTASADGGMVGACDAGCTEAGCGACGLASTHDACSDCETGPSPACSACDENATCQDSGQGVVCECSPGYAGDGLACVNVDECGAGEHECAENEVCRDTDGSYTCDCADGYVLNAGACVSPIVYLDFLPTAVNSNGTAVAGFDGTAAWLWAQGSDETLLESGLPSVTRVIAISADGQIVTATAAGTPRRWGGEPYTGASVPGIVEPMDASADGMIVVGYRDAFFPFIWDLAEGEHWTPLETSGQLYGVSGDGYIVTGSTSGRAFRLDRRRAAEIELLELPEGYSSSVGFDVANGEVIVGAAWNGSTSNESDRYVAVRWDAEAALTLDAPLGYSNARATSTNADGTRIVGDTLNHDHLNPSLEDPPISVYWPSTKTVGVFLRSYAESLGIDVSGIAELRDSTISDDGKTIVGTVDLDDESRRGFILRLP